MTTAARWRLAGAAMLLAIGCADRPAGHSLSLDVIADRYLALTTALAQHDPSLVDHWIGPAPAPPGPRRPVAALKAGIDDLRRDVQQAAQDARSGRTVIDHDRHAYLEAQADALDVAARRLLGESLPFDEEARLGLGLAPLALDTAAAHAARAALDAELPGTAPLADRLAAFRAGFTIPADRRNEVMRLALDRCRAAVAGEVPLPADESIDLVFVGGLHWDAHAAYLGGHRTRVAINAGQALDLTRALRLACHEGYPGHHVQYVWTETVLIRDRGWQEFRLVPGFGRYLLIAEGAAEAGADLAMPRDRRLAAYREVLAPAAGLPAGDLERLVRVEDLMTPLEPVIGDIARDYLDNRINAAGAAARLTAEALVPDPEALLAFIERRRSRLLAYPAGRRLVGRAAGPEGPANLRTRLLHGVKAALRADH